MLRYYDSFHAALKDAFPELAFNFLGTFLFLASLSLNSFFFFLKIRRASNTSRIRKSVDKLSMRRPVAKDSIP